MKLAHGFSLVCAFVAVSHAGLFVEQDVLFLRHTGKPFTDSATFTVANPDIPYILRIHNGPEGYNVVSSAEVHVNGTLVFSEQDFNQGVEWLEASIDVDTTNTLTAMLWGGPDGALLINVVGIDDYPPTISIMDPSSGATLPTATPAIRVSYSDNESALVLDSLRILVNGIDRTASFTVGAAEALWQVDAAQALPEGTVTVDAHIADRAANTADAQSSFVVDITPPVVTITAPADNAWYQTPGVPQGSYTAVDNIDTDLSIVEQGWSDEEGPQIYTVTATDDAGNTGSASVSYTVDNTPPGIVVTVPQAGAWYQLSQLTSPALTVTDALDPNPTYTTSGWETTEGRHVLIVTATDAAGNADTAEVPYVVDDTPPSVVINAPEDGEFYRIDDLPPADYTVTDNLDTDPVVTAEGYSTNEGTHTYSVTATDSADNTASSSVTYAVDNTAPEVFITWPTNGYETNDPNLTVQYTVDQDARTRQVTLVEGDNTIIVDSTDAAGNCGADTVQVTLQTYTPPEIAIEAPAEGQVVLQPLLPVTVNYSGSEVVPQTLRVTVNGTDVTSKLNIGLESATGWVPNDGSVRPYIGFCEPPCQAADTLEPGVVITYDIQFYYYPINQYYTGLKITNGVFCPSCGSASGCMTRTLKRNDTYLCARSNITGNTYELNNIRNLGFTGNDWWKTSISYTRPGGELFAEGPNTITASIRDARYALAVDAHTFSVDLPPELAIVSPAADTLVNDTSIDVTYTVDGSSRVRTVLLPVEGANVVVIDTTDQYGRRAADTVVVTRDTLAPVVEITSPADSIWTNQTTIDVAWTIDGVVQTSGLSHNLLNEGANLIIRSASDEACNWGYDTVCVRRDTVDPVVVIQSPATGAQGNESPVAVVWTIDGVEQDSLLTEDVVEGANTIIRSAVDSAGNEGADTVQVALGCMCFVDATETITGPHTYQCLILENSSVTFTDEIRAGYVIVDGTSRLTLTDAPLYVDSMVVQTGGRLTHAHTSWGGSPDQFNRVDIRCRVFSLEAGAEIDVNGRGYPCGYSYTGELSSSVPGSHGGRGGGNSMPAYGNYTAPTLPGGGGGLPASQASNGGGVVNIFGQRVTIAGRILANSTEGNGVSGGGGSVWIDADTLVGDGTIEAHADPIYYRYAYNRGGGGRVALTGGVISGTISDNIDVMGHQLGTIYVVNGAHKELRYAGNNGGYRRDPVFPHDVLDTSLTIIIGEGAFLSLTGTEYDLADLLVSDGSSLTARVGLRARNIVAGGTAELTLRDTVACDSLLLAPGASVTHPATTPADTVKLTIVADLVDIPAGAVIDVTGKGIPGSMNSPYPPQPQNPTYIYGSYGGRGEALAQPPYGDFRQPYEPGLGGVDNYYHRIGTGGGVVRLDAITVNLDGSIIADGIRWTDAGGAVWISADTVRGTGRLSAESRDGTGSGGGGRIAVYGRHEFSLAVDSMSTDGFSFGTIYLKSPALNQLRITGPTPADPDAHAQTCPDVDSTLEVVVANNGKLQFGPRGHVREVRVEADGQLLGGIRDRHRLSVDTLLIDSAGLLTHPPADSPYVYAAVVQADYIAVAPGGGIDVSGKGYPQYYSLDFRRVGDKYVGGTHGGQGGNSTEAPYGNAEAPVYPGGGGGGSNRGGGVVRLECHTLELNTDVRAVGRGGSTYGTGAGGSIWITADTVWGPGQLLAYSEPQELGQTTAQGGGGRIAVCAYDYPPTLLPDSAVAGYNPGTVYECVSPNVRIPLVQILTPEDSVRTNINPIPVAWTVDGIVQTEGLSEVLAEGQNLIIRSAASRAGVLGADTILVTLDTQAPEVAILSPAEGDTIRRSPWPVVWTVGGDTMVNRDLVEWMDNPGDHPVVREYVDDLGNVATDTVTVVYAPFRQDLVATALDISGVETDTAAEAISGFVTVAVSNEGDSAVEVPYAVVAFEDHNHNRLFDHGVDQVYGGAVITPPHLPYDTLTRTFDVAGSIRFVGTIMYAAVDTGDVVREISKGNNVVSSAEACDFARLSDGIGEMVLEWEWHGDTIDPRFSKVHAGPLVLQTNDDNGDGRVDETDIPDVVIHAQAPWQMLSERHVRSLSGADGSEIYTVSDATAYGGSFLDAAADIDGDGMVEILTTEQDRSTQWLQPQRLVCLEHDGTVKWVLDGDWGLFGSGHQSLQVVDLEDDGAPEIILNMTVINADGTIRAYLGSYGNHGYPSYVVDLDMDGVKEIVSDVGTFRADGELYWHVSGTFHMHGSAVANLDDDIYPEVVSVHHYGPTRVFEHDGQLKWSSPEGGTGAVVADFDGDNMPEIATLRGVSDDYTEVDVFERDGTVKWRTAVSIGSSAQYTVSMPVAFDFDADGAAELVAIDMYAMTILSGKTGAILERVPLGSNAYGCNPIVADIDGDNSAELIVARDLAEGPEGYRMGIYVFGEKYGRWANAGRIWNQNGFDVSCVNEDGTIPLRQEPGWLTHNTFRMNQAKEPWGCMDVTSSFLRPIEPCNQDTARVTVRIGTGGKLALPPDLQVSFYDGDPQAGGTLLETQTIEERLNPGEFRDLVYSTSDSSLHGYHHIYVVADDDGTGFGQIPEADEDNNVQHREFWFYDQAPVITSEPVTLVAGREDYAYQVVAEDPDGHELSYRLPFAPISMVIREDGLIAWSHYAYWMSPDKTVRVEVKDPFGGVALQEFVVVVGEAANQPPTIVSTPVTEAVEGVPYTYDVDATDPDIDPLLYRLPVVDNDTIQTPPLGMTINGVTGVISWTPNSQQGGPNDVLVTVTDGYDSTHQRFVISVVDAINRDPEILSDPVLDAEVGVPYVYDVYGLDPDLDPITYALVANPTGMTIDQNGHIAWTPGLQHEGTVDVAVRVFDDKDGQVEQAYTIAVANPNDPPVITSQPPLAALEGAAYTYQVVATDADNDPLTYFLSAAPIGMSVSAAGLITWPDDGNRSTDEYVEIEVSDDSGAMASQWWNIAIGPDDLSPSVGIAFSANPVQPGETVKVTVDATDNVGVSWTRLEVDGVAVTMDGGQYQFAPAVVGTLTVFAEAADAQGNVGSAMRSLAVTTDADNESPLVVLSMSPTIPDVGDQVSFSISATDDRPLEPDMIWLEVDGVYLPVSGGSAGWTALKRGSFIATATAYDQAGNYGSDQIGFTVNIDGGDAIPPVAAITSPADDSVVYTRAEVRGTANDANFAYYTLSYAEAGTSNWTEYDRSSTPVADGVLGYIDATSLENGSYTFRVTVYDEYGNAAYRDVRARAEGQAKVGLFTLTFEDMSVQLPGMGLDVSRTYDSRCKAKGDFGYGWRLGLRTLRLTENTSQGVGWDINLADPQNPLSGYTIGEAHPHTVTIAIPGGRTQVFAAVPHFYSQYDPTYGHISYEPQPGTYSTLEALGMGSFYVQGGELYDAGNISEVYDPTQYRLSFLDGTAYIIDQAQGGVVEVRDPNGNATSLLPNGAQHSTGDAITYVRDLQNRITSISDATGRQIDYDYDLHGNLARVTDPKGNVTRFRCAPNHYLLEIIDPRGVRATRTEYDESGRMVRQISPANDTMYFDHDIDNRTEVTVDFRGNETEYTYDDRGNVLSKRDSSGATWYYEYDDLDNLVLTTNPDNTTRGSTYDDHGNELTSTDELNHTTTRTYTAMNRLETELDAKNRLTRYEYDDRGNLERVYGPDNVLTDEKTYDGRGNVLTERDALGNLTQYEYDSKGRLTATIDPLGRRSEYILDDRGNTTAEVDAEGDTTKYFYDANDNQVMVVNALGDTTRTEYNVFDKVARQVDAKGSVTLFEYDLFGQLARTVNPDSSFSEKEYDAQGNMVLSRDEMQRETRFVYDFENRMVQTIFNDGSSSETVYDERGRRVASIDRNGNRTEYEYDDAGNNVLVRDALLNETTYEYDDVGNRVAMVDALNQRVEYEYDQYNRLRFTRFLDGTYRETVYDDAGRKVSERDQAGKVTQFEYDSVGNLVSVTDPLLLVTSYSYDEGNNRVSQTDANLHTTTMAYDPLGRLEVRTYPNGDSEKFGYDPNGNMVFKVDGNGDSTVYSYNERNREILRRYTNSGHTVATHYTAAGNRDTVIDARGMTTYEYGLCCGQLTRVNNPDGTYLQYEYDYNKNRTALITPWDTTRYTYDALNRLDTVASDGAITVYLYNEVGNRDSVVHANGTSVGYHYDGLNRLENVTNYGVGGTVISSYQYELNDAGIRTAVVEGDGSRVDYGYDGLYRLTSETRTGSYPYSIGYTYDNVGNRLTKVDSTGTTVYGYNDRDQLTSETAPSGLTSYTYDPAGRQTSKTDATGTTTYGWADNDRMVSVTGPSVNASYVYDHDGRRVQADAKRYLIDGLLPYGQVVAEYDALLAPTATYVYGLERISQDRGVVSTFVADGIGSVRQLTDVSGMVVDAYTYTAFGEELATTGATPNEFRFAGEQYEASTQLYYNRARWMSPSMGRFTSVDPHRGDVLRPPSLHRYLYGDANPVTYYDPSGRSTLLWVLGGVAVAGIIAAVAVPHIVGRDLPCVSAWNAPVIGLDFRGMEFEHEFLSSSKQDDVEAVKRRVKAEMEIAFGPYNIGYKEGRAKKTLRFDGLGGKAGEGNWGYSGNFDCENVGRVSPGQVTSDFAYQDVWWQITRERVLNFIARVAVHEAGHLYGVVKDTPCRDRPHEKHSYMHPSKDATDGFLTFASQSLSWGDYAKTNLDKYKQYFK